MWAVYVAVLGILAAYFVYIGDGQRTSIIDAPIYLLMENITRYVIPYFNIVVLILAVGVVGVGTWFYYKRKSTRDILQMFNGISIICIMLLFVVDLIQLPLFTNVIADGKRIEKDAVKIAYYLEDKEYVDVYFVITESNNYERAVYAYLKDRVICLSEEEIKNLTDKNAIVISSDKYDFEEKFQEIELSTEVLKIGKLK